MALRFSQLSRRVLANKGISSAFRASNPAAFVASRPVVTLEEAKKMPKTYRDMSNDVLITMAVMGDQEAREERLIREIMSVDNVNW